MSSFLSEIDPRSASSLGAIALALVLVSLGSTGCQPQGQQRQAAIDTTQIRATFDSLRSAFEQAVAAGDFEG